MKRSASCSEATNRLKPFLLLRQQKQASFLELLKRSAYVVIAIRDERTEHNKEMAKEFSPAGFVSHKTQNSDSDSD